MLRFVVFSEIVIIIVVLAIVRPIALLIRGGFGSLQALLVALLGNHGSDRAAESAPHVLAELVVAQEEPGGNAVRGLVPAAKKTHTHKARKNKVRKPRRAWAGDDPNS